MRLEPEGTTAPKRKVRGIKQSPPEVKPEATPSDPSEPTKERLDGLAERVKAPSLRNPLVRPMLVCALLGAISEFFVRIPGLSVIGLVGAVAATAAYPIWGWARRLHTIPSLRERLADNSYYLGFIITQISLLVGFGGPAIFQVEIQAVDVLRYFGIAIGASMTGLIARTLIMQGGHSVEEHEEIIRSEVESLSHEVSSLAGSVIADTRRMANELHAMLGSFKKSRTNIETTLGDWTTSITASLGEYGQIVEQQVALAKSGLSIADTAVKDFENATNSGTVELGNKIDTFASSIQGLQQTVVSKIDSASKVVAESATRLAEATDTAATAQGTAAESLIKISSAIQASAQSVERGNAALVALNNLESNILHMAGLLEERLAKSVESLGDVTTRTDTFKLELNASVSAFKTILEDFRKELRDSGG